MSFPGLPDLGCKSPCPAHASAQTRQRGADAGSRAAVGADFEAAGKLECHLLLSLGLAAGHRVLEIGCGCGRLAVQLARLPGVSYGGTDVAPQLLRHARAICGRPFWDFVEADGASIPFPDASADFVCLFSVATGLPHEPSFGYFPEAARCLREGGKLVVSFLEFRVPSHWAAFEASTRQASPGAHASRFIDRDALAAWAAHAGLEVEAIRGADTLHIPVPEEIVPGSGGRKGSLASLGQSVAVLGKARARRV